MLEVANMLVPAVVAHNDKVIIYKNAGGLPGMEMYAGILSMYTGMAQAVDPQFRTQIKSTST